MAGSWQYYLFDGDIEHDRIGEPIRYPCLGLTEAWGGARQHVLIVQYVLVRGRQVEIKLGQGDTRRNYTLQVLDLISTKVNIAIVVYKDGIVHERGCCQI